MPLREAKGLICAGPGRWAHSRPVSRGQGQAVVYWCSCMWLLWCPCDVQVAVVQDLCYVHTQARQLSGGVHINMQHTVTNVHTHQVSHVLGDSLKGHAQQGQSTSKGRTAIRFFCFRCLVLHSCGRATGLPTLTATVPYLDIIMERRSNTSTNNACLLQSKKRPWCMQQLLQGFVICKRPQPYRVGVRKSRPVQCCHCIIHRL